MAALKIAKKLVSIAKGTTKTASDGNQYRWLGAQWAKVGKSGKAGQMARRGIAAELTSSESGKRVSKSKQAKKSVAWFKKKVGDSAKGFKKKTALAPGKMYTFGYDAKLKAILPYWDKFPLIIVLDVYKDGFLGLNFHYVSPIDRAKFFAKIMKFATQKGEPEDMTDKARFNVSWDAVKNIKGADKMIHKYLYGHVRTSLLEAPPNEWENVIFLPYQRFVGASAKAVWKK
tara:strand:- start:666 stop:1355 length:690 start_codon:yes stop_codon:yes gene_type:complete